jgi:hypothetical protein
VECTCGRYVAGKQALSNHHDLSDLLALSFSPCVVCLRLTNPAAIARHENAFSMLNLAHFCALAVDKNQLLCGVARKTAEVTIR